MCQPDRPGPRDPRHPSTFNRPLDTPRGQPESNGKSKPRWGMQN